MLYTSMLYTKMQSKEKLRQPTEFTNRGTEKEREKNMRYFLFWNANILNASDMECESLYLAPPKKSAPFVFQALPSYRP